MSTTESTGRKTKSGLLNYKGMLIGLVIGAGVGFGGFTVIKDRQADQQAELAKISSRLESSKQHEREMRLLTTGNNLSDLRSWTSGLAGTPASVERDKFAIAVYNATKDDVVTEAEYNALARQYKNLEDYSTNQDINERATKILNGEDIESEVKTEEQRGGEFIRSLNKAQQRMDELNAIHYKRLVEGAGK